MQEHDYNLYKDWQNNTVVLEIYGLKNQNTGLQEKVETLYFDSYEVARYYILKKSKPDLFY